ncbi:MAG: thioredoxin domain-containing protein [Alphaproteobacteria bacterium]|nr:thioredoxin domain-containing protein [Alphaproteobacteria bacterium]
MTHNFLADENSPYLLQHAGNPVHWYPWGEEALIRAKAEDKPILLSIGYAACHWCHVMAHESFENEDTAAVMNRLFINIKVDREERPDLDAIYQSALSLMGQQGGWPLTMFCTPDGKPFWGGTYFPPRPGFGRPGFPDLVEHIDKIYRTEQDKVALNTRAIVEAINDMSTPEPGDTPAPDLIVAIANRFTEEIDKTHGGFGTAPKFPQCSVLKMMWAHGNAATRDAVTLTLDRMAQGGIYDHLGGGFARYSTDPAWLAPHFEKMLYDNAQLLELYTAAWRATGNPLYSNTVHETITWIQREMTHRDGGIYSTLDADSERVEGKFYVWNEDEIKAVLEDDFAFFAATYDIRPDGNWEGHTILNRSQDPALKDPTTEAHLSKLRAKLFAAREPRIRPALDDKILTDWNGLMVFALVEAAMAFENPEWLTAAQSAYDFVRENMVINEDLELHHSCRNGDARHRATLDDYVMLARAALSLHEATGNPDALSDAQGLMTYVENHFTSDDGAYFFTDDNATDVITRTKTGFDNATPAGNGIAAEVLVRLYYLTAKLHYRDRAEGVLRAFAGDITENAFSYGTLLMAAGQLAEAIQVAIIGALDDPKTLALRAAAYRGKTPTRIVSVVAPDDSLPDTHPAFGKTRVNGTPSAYVCRGPVCSLPVQDPEQLITELTA